MSITRTLVAGTLAITALAVGAGGALAAKPETVHSGQVVETFFDDFILDVCGIETMTTVTERWTLTTYADGSQRFTNSRKFVPQDRRIPIEYGVRHVDSGTRPASRPSTARRSASSVAAKGSSCSTPGS